MFSISDAIDRKNLLDEFNGLLMRQKWEINYVLETEFFPNFLKT